MGEKSINREVYFIGILLRHSEETYVLRNRLCLGLNCLLTVPRANNLLYEHFVPSIDFSVLPKYPIQGSLGLISETWLPISGDIEIERITRELRRTEDIGVYMYYLFQDTNLATTWDHTTNLECQ